MRAEHLSVYQRSYSHSAGVFGKRSFSLTEVTWPEGGIAQLGVRVLGRHISQAEMGSQFGRASAGCSPTVFQCGRTSFPAVKLECMIFNMLMATCME